MVLILANIYSASHQTNTIDEEMNIIRLKAKVTKIWDKVFKNGPSKIVYLFTKILLGPFLNTLSQIYVTLGFTSIFNLQLLLYNPLRPNPTILSNTPKQLLLLASCLSVFEHFVGPAFKRAIF